MRKNDYGKSRKKNRELIKPQEGFNWTVVPVDRVFLTTESEGNVSKGVAVYQERQYTDIYVDHSEDIKWTHFSYL